MNRGTTFRYGPEIRDSLEDKRHSFIRSDVTATNTFVWIVRTGTDYYFADCFSDDTVQNPVKVSASLTVPAGNKMVDLH